MSSSRALAGALLLAAAASSAHADEPTYKFAGSVRARYEGLSGQSRAGFKSGDELASFRTMLGGEADFGLLRVGGELTDSRAYLADRTSAVSSNDVDALEPSQLYVGLDFDQPFGKGSALGAQAGRFTMNIGSRRLVSNDEYRNTNSSVAGLRLDGKWSGWSGTAWYVLPDTRLPDDIDSVLDNDVQLDRESHHTVLWGGILSSPRIVANGAVDFTYMKFRESDAPGRPTADRDLDTWSLRWYRDASPAHWDYEVEAIRQGGRARTGTTATAPLRDVDAGFWHARIGYQWALPWKPRVAVEYDRASGNSGSDKIRRFDTLYGGRRFELAPSGLYNQVSRANLSTPGLRLELTPDARTDFMATWKLLYLASQTDAFSGTGVRDATGRSGNYAGQQFDLRGRYWLVPKRLRAEVDTLVLVKGRFLETAPNARPGDTRYYSLNLTWSF
jgi:hypothetical protein